MTQSEGAPHYTINAETGKWAINKAAIQEMKLLVGGPCYDACIRAPTHSADMRLQNLLANIGIQELAFEDLYNESCCPRGRNVMAARCLAGGWTHFLSRDADADYDPENVLKMLAMNLDVVAMAFPKKGINWKKAKEFMAEKVRGDYRSEPGYIIDISDEMLEAHSLDYVLEVPEKPVMRNGGVETTRINDGLMLIKREVFEMMIAEQVVDKIACPQFPELEYFSYDFFCETVTDGEHKTCDYAFCDRWRECGGTVWMLPGKIGHVGVYNFRGDTSIFVKEAK